MRLGSFRFALGLTFGLVLGVSLGPPGQPAWAEDTPLQMLDTATAAQRWGAVGLVDIGGTGICTGTLIAPDRVLTAAHCLYNGNGAARLADGSMRFLAGWRNGRALTERRVRRAFAHPDYVHDPGAGVEDSRFDLAILVLDEPIRSTRVVPFPVVTGQSVGREVGIVSYAKGRTDAPALQSACGVIGFEAGLVVMSCSVDFGSSGAPVFHMGPEGPEIVSVVLAKAEYEGDSVAVGTLLGSNFTELQQVVAEDDGGGPRPGIVRTDKPGGARMISAGERPETGARFVRP
jgi:protease YdgD